MLPIRLFAVRLTGLAVLALLSACAFGPRGENLSLAQRPRGATVTLETATRPIRGELLEVQDTALLVLSQVERLTLVPYRAIRRGEAELVRKITGAGSTPSARQSERLRRVSRYPQGVSPDLLRALLTAYNQSELEVVRQ